MGTSSTDTEQMQMFTGDEAINAATEEGQMITYSTQDFEEINSTGMVITDSAQEVEMISDSTEEEVQVISSTDMVVMGSAQEVEMITDTTEEVQIIPGPTQDLEAIPDSTNQIQAVCSCDGAVQTEVITIPSEEDTEEDDADRTILMCSNCNEVFYTRHHFAVHECSKLEKAETLTGFLCPWCENRYYNLKELKYHVKMCWKGMLTCIICSKTICGKLALIKHLQDHKKQSSQAQTRAKACLVCGLFDEKWDLTHHWRQHTGVDLLKCVVCKKVMSLSNLLTHLNSHRANPQYSDLSWCPSCGLTFINKAAFENHRNGHTTRKYCYLCECCGLFFHNMNDLEQHILYHVGMNTVYKCITCKRIYPFREHFEIHTKTCFKLAESNLDRSPATALAVMKVMVEKYLKVFNTHTLDLIRYSNKKDVPETPMQSLPPPPPPPPPPSEPDNSVVVMKLREEDKTVLMYSCQVCQKRLVGKESFARHWREHTGYDPNKCVLCTETFTHSKLLETHMLVAHSYHLYKCSSCSLVFQTSLENKYHTLAHLKNCAYFCEVCGTGFNEFNYLEYHVFTTHVKQCVLKNSLMSKQDVSIVNHPLPVPAHAVSSSICESTGEVEVIVPDTQTTSAAKLTEKGARKVPEFYMCSVCKAASNSLPAMIEHTKSHGT